MSEDRNVNPDHPESNQDPADPEVAFDWRDRGERGMWRIGVDATGRKLYTQEVDSGRVELHFQPTGRGREPASREGPGASGHHLPAGGRSRVYLGRREPDGTTAVEVIDARGRRPLSADSIHPPAQFDWGEEGPGARLLARSLVADRLAAPAPEPVAKRLTWFLAQLDRSSWVLPSGDLDRWLAAEPQARDQLRERRRRLERELGRLDDRRSQLLEQIGDLDHQLGTRRTRARTRSHETEIEPPGQELA